MQRGPIKKAALPLSTKEPSTLPGLVLEELWWPKSPVCKFWGCGDGNLYSVLRKEVHKLLSGLGNGRKRSNHKPRGGNP